jgi:diguanylate cyclase (GGDEF)-like protein
MKTNLLTVAFTLPGLSKPNAQSLRLKRSFAAAWVSLALVAWLAIGALLDKVSWLAVAATAGLLCVATMAVVTTIRKNWNLALSDPDLTLPIVLTACSCVLLNAAFLDNASSNVLILWLLLAFSFGAITAPARVLCQLAVCIGLLILSLYGWKVWQKSLPPQAFWFAAVPVVALLALASYGGKINDRKRRTRARQQLADLTFKTMSDAVLNLDPNGVVQGFNPAALKLFPQLGVMPGEMQFTAFIKSQVPNPEDVQVQEVIDSILPGDSSAQVKGLEPAELETKTNIFDIFVTQSSDYISNSEPTKTEKRRTEKRLHRVETSISRVIDCSGALTGHLVVIKDITESHNSMLMLNHESNHDPMTNLLNRRGINRALQNVERALTLEPQARFAILIVDLDNLKIVNDTCGHMAGDALIQSVADLLKGSIRAGDVIGRFGGDEFAIIISHTSQAEVASISQRIVDSTRSMNFVWEGKNFRTGASIGAIVVDHSSFDIVGSLAKADSALYLAKDLGKGRVQFHSENDAQIEKKSKQLDWAWRLNNAAENNAFTLFAQRIVTLDQNSISHFEVLLRLKNDDGTLISPIAFIPAAERFNLMPMIDKWVINRCVAQLRSLHRECGVIPKVTINLSAQSLNEPGFLEFAENALQSSGLALNNIGFELTETLAVTNFAVAKQFIDRLRGLGCEFYLDDVGAGFNSISYLEKLTFDAIKIDGHHVKSMMTDPVSLSLVKTLTDASHAMGLKTIAEMVETPATVDFLVELGIRSFQGYHFHVPEPLEIALRSGQERVVITQPRQYSVFDSLKLER